MRRGRLWLATILLMLAACGKPAPPGQVGSAPVYVDPVCHTHVLTPGVPSDPGPARSALPADFETAAVVRCREETRDVPDQGKWSFQITERADTPAAELIAQLRRSSDARTATACPDMLVIVPEFYLLDAAGKAIAPAVPTDTCNQPRREALAELEKLSYKPVSEQQLAQVQSKQSITSGCSDQFKDLFAIDGMKLRGATGSVFAAPVTTLKVCVYNRSDRDQEPVGTLSAAYPVEPKAVLAALDKAGPAADCALPHTRFAVLTSPSDGGFVMVELDGCHRLLRSNNTLGQLDAGAVALLINK